MNKSISVASSQVSVGHNSSTQASSKAPPPVIKALGTATSYNLIRSDEITPRAQTSRQNQVSPRLPITGSCLHTITKQKFLKERVQQKLLVSMTETKSGISLNDFLASRTPSKLRRKIEETELSSILTRMRKKENLIRKEQTAKARLIQQPFIEKSRQKHCSKTTAQSPRSLRKHRHVLPSKLTTQSNLFKLVHEF